MDEDLLEVDDIFREIDSISSTNHNSRSGLNHQRVQKIRATQTEDELTKIFYLVDSHVPSLRERAAMRYERILNKNNCEESRDQLQMLKDIISTKCGLDPSKGIEEMKKHIAEMPKEWTIIQLTSEYNPQEHQNLDLKTYETNGLHLVVFDCGQTETDPYSVSLNPPSVGGNKVELMQQFMNALDEINERLTQTAKRKFFKNRKEKHDYILKSEDSEFSLKGIVKQIEENWLRHWRCLLIGKYQDTSIEQNIKKEVNKIITDQLGEINISQKKQQMLCQIVKGASFLRRVEVLRGIQYCLGDLKNEDVLKELGRLIQELNVRINNNHEILLRHPVILVVDESLDSLPWEMVDVLNEEPISRVPSLHFAYFLFKAHEHDIEEGQKIITNYKNGKYIVNPDRDLVHMEARMMSFYNYWLQHWDGINDRKPTSDEFYDLLKNADIFSYSGHGNGTHIMTIEMIQRINVRAVVLLFGCASTRIARLGTQVEMYGSYHMYLISRCPCVLGMLWPVTDVYTDLLTAEFLSSWIPSTAPIPWSNVDKHQWIKATKCDSFVATTDKTANGKANNLELLRALVHSKKLTDHYLTKAACVVRGLPVKIKLKQ